MSLKPPYADGTSVQLILYPLLALSYGGAIFTCAFADYFYIRRGHRSFYGKIDIRFAGFFFFSVFDFSLRGSLLETFCLSFMAALAFMFSG